MSSEDQKAEYVSRAKLSEQAERYDDMAEFMRLVTESGIGKSVRGSIIRELREISHFILFHPFFCQFQGSWDERDVPRIPGQSFFCKMTLVK